jgi:hypothetical protein
MRTDRKKLKWLNKKVMEVDLSFNKIFLLDQLSYTTHGMGWDDLQILFKSPDENITATSL